MNVLAVELILYGGSELRSSLVGFHFSSLPLLPANTQIEIWILEFLLARGFYVAILLVGTNDRNEHRGKIVAKRQSNSGTGIDLPGIPSPNLISFPFQSLSEAEKLPD